MLLRLARFFLKYAVPISQKTCRATPSFGSGGSPIAPANKNPWQNLFVLPRVCFKNCSIWENPRIIVRGFRPSRNLHNEKRSFTLPFTNPQKATTCAWLFALIQGQVYAEGVHAAPCKNSKKWLLPLFRHAKTPGPSSGGFLYKRGSVCFLRKDYSFQLKFSMRTSPAPLISTFSRLAL